MLTPGVVGRSPLWVDYRALTHLDDEVTWVEANLSRSQRQIDVGPLIAMVMDIVGDFAEQDTFGFKDPVRLTEKVGICVRKVVPTFFWRLKYQPEADIKVLLLVFPLIRDVWRVVNNYVNEFIA